MPALLQIDNLRTHFKTHDGIVKASDGVSFRLDSGEVLALVGESGSGKSVTARSIMGLYSGSKTVCSGSILYDGEDLAAASPKRRRELRGKDISMIFQEPMSTFDPLSTICQQMVEARQAHFAESAERAKALAVEALKAVGIPEPALRVDNFPHQMSGGMLQRVLIATAIMNKPRILIADEPTTALDVTIQAQVLRLLYALRAETGSSLLFITHDLGVVAEIADRVHVMYAGKIVEKATVGGLFKNPAHPYTKGLLASRIDKNSKGRLLPSIPGAVPRPDQIMENCCRFAPRCAFAGPRCRSEEPVLQTLAQNGCECACWLYNGGVA